jgi:predicted ATP-dependent protease
LKKIRNSHHPDRQFIIVHGTAVALKQGIPVATFERKGLTLRVFDETVLAEALVAFAEAGFERVMWNGWFIGNFMQVINFQFCT